jgi:hypothetical protein
MTTPLHFKHCYIHEGQHCSCGVPTPDIARLDVAEAVLIADLKAIAARREREGLLAEQRHQLLDLDADSTCPFEGACRYPYLTAGGQS